MMELDNKGSTDKNTKKKYVLSRPVSVNNNRAQSNESHSTDTNESNSSEDRKERNKSINYLGCVISFFNGNDHKYRYLGVTILIIALVFGLLPGPGPDKPPSRFFNNLANMIIGISRDIDSVKLPAADKVIDHVVACRRAANMIRNSPAFKSYGVHISSGLVSFGEKIVLAGRGLRNMNSKGSSLYESFDVEVDAMMQRLRSNARQGDSKYFKERLKNLIIKVQDFRKVVGKTQMAFKIAEDTRQSAEGYIIDGMREAEKFVTKNDEHRVDIVRAHKEIGTVNEILVHLKDTAGNLMQMHTFLMTYEDRLLDLQVSLDKPGTDYEYGIFEVTKPDLNYLKISVDKLKDYHQSFDIKAGISN
ncbi:4649_t:CDS:2 [Funneliformis mosseae]|uniref:4649_t:CDS:1 n=1 Tax=Funneliformis mosseae TaxID=27381 RepID=A0A9N9C3I0_FUNMO|nr:4649_t:CDS:2 [Funneliformis mosseae]